jgi:methionyl-tRNA synthetase
MVAPYMPETAQSINRQLCIDALLIPNEWDANSIKPGHKIGKAEYLFGRIKPEKAEEWLQEFGSEQVKKVKEEELDMKARKSATIKAKVSSNSKEQ